MPASKHQLAASAYHIRPADVRKLLLAAPNFRDWCLIKTLWWLGDRAKSCNFGDCSKATGLIQPVHDEVRQGCVAGLRRGLHATYPAPGAH